MTIRHFVLQLFLTALVLAAANVVVWKMARNSVPRQLLRKAATSEPATAVFLGNSTMAAGLDERAFESVAGGKALNLAIGATYAIEHNLVFRQQEKHRGATVCYGFFDFQLTERPEGNWELLTGNHAMVYYVEPEIGIKYFTVNAPFTGTFLRAASLFPVLVERQALWAKVEICRRLLGEIGMPKSAQGHFGRVEDFNKLESSERDFFDHCSSVVAEHQPLSPAVSDLFELVKARKSRLVVVQMPLPAKHRQKFYTKKEWLDYRDYMAQLIQKAGGEFIPAEDWIEDKGFEDALHLNTEGAVIFSKRLAERVRAKP